MPGVRPSVTKSLPRTVVLVPKVAIGSAIPK